jgi:hypothetical protein
MIDKILFATPEFHKSSKISKWHPILGFEIFENCELLHFRDRHFQGKFPNPPGSFFFGVQPRNRFWSMLPCASTQHTSPCFSKSFWSSSRLHLSQHRRIRSRSSRTPTSLPTRLRLCHSSIIHSRLSIQTAQRLMWSSKFFRAAFSPLPPSTRRPHSSITIGETLIIKVTSTGRSSIIPRTYVEAAIPISVERSILRPNFCSDCDRSIFNASLLVDQL